MFDDTVPPSLADGDTIWVLSGTYTLTTQQLSQIGNKTLYFIGQMPSRPLIKRTTGSSGSWMVTFDDATPGSHNLLVKDIRFEESSSATGLTLLATDYRRIDIVNVDVTTTASTPHVFVRSDTMNVTSGTMVGNGVLLSHANRTGVQATHTVTDAAFQQTGTGYTTVGVAAETNGATSSFIYDGCVFTFAQSSPGAGAIDLDGSGGTSYVLAAILIDNDFVNRRIDLRGNGDITRAVLYDGNEQDYDQCVEDVISPAADVSLFKSWIYNASLYSYEDFGGFSNLNAIVLHLETPDRTYGFVQFSLALGAENDNQDIVDVKVRYGDSACNEGTVDACYNSSTGKWNAQFDVTGWEPNYYWRPEATVCDTTRVGSCTLKSYNVIPSGDDPPSWFDCD